MTDDVQFPIVPLSDVVRFANGKVIKPGGTGEFPVYGSNGIIGGCDASNHEKAIILGRVGAYCGSVMLCRGPFWASDNTIVAYPANELVDLEFLYYALGQAGLNKYAGGAAQPLITHTVLRQVSIGLPDLPTQRRIAGILSAYDELIANNQRRIAVLEQMARALYREWFVYFRAPGVRLQSGSQVPEGWEVNRLGELFDFIGGSQPPKSEHIHEEREGYDRFIQNRDYGSSSHITYIRSSSRNKYCERLDVMVDKYGEPGTTRYGLAGAYNVALAKLRPFQANYREWLRWLITEPDFRTYLAGASMAATRASLNSSHFNMEVPVPPNHIASAFEQNVGPLLQLVLVHKDAIENLRRTRDLLLPRLMSGRVELNNVVA